MSSLAPPPELSSISNAICVSTTPVHDQLLIKAQEALHNAHAALDATRIEIQESLCRGRREIAAEMEAQQQEHLTKMDMLRAKLQQLEAEGSAHLEAVEATRTATSLAAQGEFRRLLETFSIFCDDAEENVGAKLRDKGLIASTASPTPLDSTRRDRGATNYSNLFFGRHDSLEGAFEHHVSSGGFSHTDFLFPDVHDQHDPASSSSSTTTTTATTTLLTAHDDEGFNGLHLGEDNDDFSGDAILGYERRSLNEEGKRVEPPATSRVSSGVVQTTPSSSLMPPRDSKDEEIEVDYEPPVDTKRGGGASLFSSLTQRQHLSHRIVVGNLELENRHDPEPLLRHFAQFGELTFVWVGWKDPCHAYLDFSTREAAQKAVSAGTREGIKFNGRTLSVQFERNPRLFIRRAGAAGESRRDDDGGHQRSSDYRYDNEREGSEEDNNKRARTSTSSSSPRRSLSSYDLHITGLSSDTTWKQVRDLFEEALRSSARALGRVGYVTMGASGEADVEFTHKGDARSMMEKFDGSTVGGRQVRVRWRVRG